MIEAAELFTRGDLATVCIQYGRYPSFLSLQKVRAGRRQFRSLAWGVHQRVRAMPEDRRPRVLVFGESLGAWASSGRHHVDSVSTDWTTTGSTRHCGSVCLSWPAGPQPGLDRPGQLTPEGTVGVFDRWEQFAELTPQERDALRIVQLSHDNDPITLLTPTLLYRSPDWLEEPRGRNVPGGQRWYPVVTGVQTMIDAANAMRNSPGEFRSTGHDYRADTARFVAEGYRLPYTEQQLAAVEDLLRRLEREREGRIKAPTDTADTVPAPAHRTEHHLQSPHLPSLHGHRTKGANWINDVADQLGRHPLRTAERRRVLIPPVARSERQVRDQVRPLGSPTTRNW